MIVDSVECDWNGLMNMGHKMLVGVGVEIDLSLALFAGGSPFLPVWSWSVCHMKESLA